MLLSQRPDRHHESQILDRARAELPQGATHFAQPGSRCFSSRPQHGLGSPGIPLGLGARCLELNRYGSEGMCQGVVEFPRHAVALPTDAELLQTCGKPREPQMRLLEVGVLPTLHTNE